MRTQINKPAKSSSQEPYYGKADSLFSWGWKYG